MSSFYLSVAFTKNLFKFKLNHFKMELINGLGYPDLKLEFANQYRKAFLKANNLKIGDAALFEFRFDILRSSYKGRPEKFGANEVSEGILKVDENGVLYAESLKDYHYWADVWNGRTGRQSRYSWKRTTKKAITKIAHGLSYIELKI